MHLFQVLPLDHILIAQAAPASGAGQPALTDVLFQMAPLIIAFFAIIYFLQIRPQQKREKEKQAMLNAVKKGDKVVTIGGIHGSVVGVKEDTVVLRVDDGTTIEFERRAVNHVHSPATDDN
jgi:preprotein translocase subunit YajC